MADDTGKRLTDKRVADPRWRRTRERLLQVGFELIGEGGAEGVNIDIITARARISKQTFYNHFADRDMLTQELWLESRRVFTQAITTANAGLTDPVQRLARGVAIYARLAVDDPHHARFIVRTHIGRGMLDNGNHGLQRDLLDALGQGRLSFDQLDTATRFVTGVTMALMLQILEVDQAQRRAALCAETLLMLLRGLGCGGADAALIAGDAARHIAGS